MHRLAVALCAPALIRSAPARQGGAPVAVASSLRFVWPALRQAAGSPALQASFGASRTLARQMLQGAPFELLLSADAESIALLIDAGLADADQVVDYAQGRLVWVSRADDAPDDAASLARWWRASPARRLAIAHPQHAPYGRAAVQVLQALSIGPIDARQLLRGENAGQALQFFTAGAADAALLPVSLVRHAATLLASETRLPWSELPIDPSLHSPLAHRAVAVRGAGRPARRLLEALTGQAVRPSLQAAGLVPAGGG